MLLHANIHPLNMDELFHQHPSDARRHRAEEALQSQVIVGFEQAIALGVPPLEALAFMLSWVATEMARIQTAALSKDDIVSPSPAAPSNAREECHPVSYNLDLFHPAANEKRA